MSSQRVVTFRDPPPAEQRARELQLELASLLARAPSLPAPLPVDGLSLTAIEADRGGIELVLSRRGPGARLRLTEGSGAVKGEARVLDPSLSAVHLEQLAARLARATDAARWAKARALADELSRQPVGVQLDFLRQVVSGVRPLTGLLRTGFRCNQDCGLCWQARDWKDFGSAQVLIWIEDLARAGVDRVIFSGGEPTIDPSLFRYLQHAQKLGFAHVTLETNAVMMAKPGFALRLREAGVNHAFVSLHAADAELSDAITRAPGTHASTVRGISALLDAGVNVALNAVMTAQSVGALEKLPGFVRETFGAHRSLKGLMISYPTEPYERGLETAAAPRPELLRAALRATLEAAHQARLDIHGLEGPCGPPLCAHGADRRFVPVTPVPETVPFRVYLEACDRCTVRASCFGVRRTDYQRYGERCAEPIT
jgi:MoaA/NifB/PqqE/SkfB family radical SAM enzyme